MLTLILSSLQQSLRDLVLLYDVDVRAPSGESISIDGVEERLGDSFEKILGPLIYRLELAWSMIDG